MTTNPIETAFIDVTPDLANEWLNRNEINRNLDVKRIKMYASAMRLGAWQVSNDDICIDPNGMLLNGQHRLHAVIEAGVTVPMHVKFNVPTAAMGTMDRGKIRNYSQHLRFRGEQSVALLGATLRLSLQLYLGISDTGTKGDADHDVFLAQHPEIRKSVKLADRIKASVAAATPSSIASAHWLISAVQATETKAVDRFFYQIANPSNQPDGSPILALNQRLMIILQQQQKVQSREYVYLFVQAWNLHATGEKAYNLRRLRMRRKNGPFSLPEIAQYGAARNPDTTPDIQEYLDEIDEESRA